MKTIIKSISLILLFVFSTLAYAQSKLNEPPSLVWIRAEGAERNEYLFFRREIVLEETPNEAIIHLYADSRYAFYINGVYVGFGPSRSFHENPYYDSYDISKFLQKGTNILSAKVLCNGMVTFQLFDYHGAFSAWGAIKTNSQNIDLDIQKGWLCKKSLGYDQSAPRFSFATGPIEVWDTRPDSNWQSENIDTSEWSKPVAVKNQSEIWGPFQSRPIPHLTQKEILPIRYKGMYPLQNNETIYSFRIPTPDLNLDQYNDKNTAMAYTYIYSPEDQVVQAGLWWGNYYLNGQKVTQQEYQPESGYRLQHVLDLKKGWNEFVVRYDIIWGSWDFYMAVPKNASIELSPNKQFNDGSFIKSYAPLKRKSQLLLQELDLTLPIQKIIKNSKGNWKSHDKNEHANQPARDLAWFRLDTAQQKPVSFNKEGELHIAPDSIGWALIMELNAIQLGRIFVEGDFPEGTVIDIAFSEELDKNGYPWLYKRYQVGSGIRFVTNTSQKRYESFKPYGAKYLHINFRNFEDTIKLKKAGIVRQVYPFKTLGSFTCSDPIFDRIWDAGWRTLQLCAEDSYTDTPFRERGLYAGDMLPEAAITMAVSGDMRLVEYSLHLFHDMYQSEMMEGSENRHNDFPLITLITLHMTAHYSGDWSLARKYYNNYASLLKWHISKKNETGLIPAGRVFLEWTQINKSGAAMTAYQALLVRSMEILSEWSLKFDKDEDIYFSDEATKLKQSINSIFYDPDKSAYYDGYKNGEPIKSYFPTSSIWPLLFNVVPDDRKNQVLNFLKQELTDIGETTRHRKITPYSSFYLFRLLYRFEEAEFAEFFMKKHWKPMALHSATPTVWENFDIGGEQGTSSHAWSGHPTYFMATQILGVQLPPDASVNPNEIVISPISAHLSWAAGTVMHPAGPVEVNWEVKGNLLVLKYKAPAGTAVKVNPRGRLQTLKLITQEMD